MPFHFTLASRWPPGSAPNSIPWMAFAAMLLAAQPTGLRAQVVQLPSYRAFQYSGSAWVPDGGTVELGGVGYSSSSSTARGFGPVSSRAAGRSVGATSITASAQIIDLQALDEAILSGSGPLKSAAGSGTATAPVAGNAPAKAVTAPTSLAETRKYISRSDDSGSAGGRQRIPPGQWQRMWASGGSAVSSDPSLAESNIRYYLHQAAEAEKANRILAVRVYHRMAIEAMTPELLQRYEQVVAERQAAAEQAAAEQAAAGVVKF